MKYTENKIMYITESRTAGIFQTTAPVIVELFTKYALYMYCQHPSPRVDFNGTLMCVCV